MQKTLTIKKDNCPQNHPCPAVKVCPVGALSQTNHNAPIIYQSLCIGCVMCSDFCPKKALVLE